MTGPELTALREIHGWTQARLSEALKVPQSTVSDWETGKHPINWRTQLAIRCVLGGDRGAPMISPERLAEIRAAVAFDALPAMDAWDELLKRHGAADTDAMKAELEERTRACRRDRADLLAAYEERGAEIERTRSAFAAVLRDVGYELVGHEIRRLVPGDEPSVWVGQVWRSLDPRDAGKRVQIVDWDARHREAHGEDGWYWRTVMPDGSLGRLSGGSAGGLRQRYRLERGLEAPR